MRTGKETEFETFVFDIEPRLRRALVGHLRPAIVPDAMSEAFTHAWKNWAEVRAMDNPAGYLFRVAQSKSRSRMQGALPDPYPHRVPDMEPGLPAAMRSLPPRQRSAVWLVHACGWTYAECADALGISASAVGTHLNRGLAALRSALGVTIDE